MGESLRKVQGFGWKDSNLLSRIQKPMPYLFGFTQVSCPPMAWRGRQVAALLLVGYIAQMKEHSSFKRKSVGLTPTILTHEVCPHVL